MKVYRSFNEIPQDFAASVLSVGNFDGVHLAHRQVLQEVVSSARNLGAKSLAVTFEPHPLRVLRPDLELKLLSPLPEKLRLLQETGLDAVLVTPFDKEFSLLTPEEFAVGILCRKLNAMEVHVGENFRFGRNASGNVKLLLSLASAAGFRVIVDPEMHFRGEIVSSSRIRKLLQVGNVSRARHLLGRPFYIAGRTEAGAGVGRIQTVPTVNLGAYSELLPENGVYITAAKIGTDCFHSVTNVGVRPTFANRGMGVETHLLEFPPQEIPADTRVDLLFFRRLRPEIKFASVEALRHQIDHDVARARRWVSLQSRPI